MWFIGLEFLKVQAGGVNLELTYEIQIFVNSGMSSLTSIYSMTSCELDIFNVTFLYLLWLLTFLWKVDFYGGLTHKN